MTFTVILQLAVSLLAILISALLLFLKRRQVSDGLFFVISSTLIFILAAMGMGFAVAIERFVQMGQTRQQAVLAGDAGMKTTPDETAPKAPLSGSGQFADQIEAGQPFEVPHPEIRMMPIQLPDGAVYWLSEKEITFREFLIYLNDSGKEGDVYSSGGTLDPYVKLADGYALREPALSLWDADDKPAVSVTWSGAQNFCNWLNESLGKKIPVGYRFSLPSVEEWQFACRSGKSDSVSGNAEGDPSYVALIKGAGFTMSVGSYPPNEFGLYDMHGNVMEWSRSVDASIDIFGRGPDQRAEQRYACGTAFFSPNDVNACDALSSFVSSFGTEYVGFRLALVLDQ